MPSIYTVRDILDFAIAQKPSAMKDAFASVMAEKVSERRLALKKTIASSLFAESSDEDEEEDDDDDDDGDKKPSKKDDEELSEGTKWSYEDGRGVSCTGTFIKSVEGNGTDVAYHFKNDKTGTTDVVSGSRLKKAKKL